MKRVSTGELVGQCFTSWFQNFGPVFLLTLVAHLPALGVTWWSISTLDRTAPETWGAHLGGSIWAQVALGPLMNLVATGAIGFGVLRSLSAQPATLGEWFSHGLSALPQLIGVAVLTLLATAIGLFLFVAPGILIMVALTVAPVATVAEQLPTTTAMQRSFALTLGSRAPIFASQLCVALLTTVPVWVAARLAMGQPTTIESSYDAAIRSILVSEALGLLLGGAFVVLPAVTYHALRTTREGVDASALARIFD